ncbi:hypothetical protein Taro_033229 [Colocasia esculenta]|uniref:t-SNARE coiled-coil homology domain-containing protein n=1 Tax=Colocasia esculenta TaxID=4460 RepID=A0A843W8F8_COLES|nr:hypothetical protein [Colocasia esculenta]
MNDLMTKSFLSYVELKRQAMADLEAGSLPAPVPPEGRQQEEETQFAQFFQEVGAIQQEMEAISGLLLELLNLAQETRTAHSGGALRGIRDRMDFGVAAVLRKAGAVRARLGALDRLPPASSGGGGAADRARASVTSGLRAKLGEMMGEFQRLREQIAAEHRDVLKMRHFSATGETASEETIEKMMRSGEGGGQALAVVGDGRERDRAVGELQRSLTRLQQVFLDMAALVDAQGEGLEDIDGNVGRAGVCVGGGTGCLAAAKGMEKAAQGSWVWWVWVVVLILLLTCLIPIFTGD